MKMNKLKHPWFLYVIVFLLALTSISGWVLYYKESKAQTYRKCHMYHIKELVQLEHDGIINMLQLFDAVHGKPGYRKTP